MEFLGISTSVWGIELEKTLDKIVDKGGVEINDRDIEFYNCVRGRGRTIVTFSHRKDCQRIRKVKKDLSNLNLTDIDLGNTKIFIKASVQIIDNSPPYCRLLCTLDVLTCCVLFLKFF